MTALYPGAALARLFLDGTESVHQSPKIASFHAKG